MKMEQGIQVQIQLGQQIMVLLVNTSNVISTLAMGYVMRVTIFHNVTMTEVSIAMLECNCTDKLILKPMS